MQCGSGAHAAVPRSFLLCATGGSQPGLLRAGDGARARSKGEVEVDGAPGPLERGKAHWGEKGLAIRAVQGTPVWTLPLGH